MLSPVFLAGWLRGEPTEGRLEALWGTGWSSGWAGLGGLRVREAGRSGGCMGACGGLKAAKGRSLGCAGCTFGLPWLEDMEPMRSSSARNVSEASMLPPRPSIDLVRRWVLPPAGIRWQHHIVGAGTAKGTSGSEMTRNLVLLRPAVQSSSRVSWGLPTHNTICGNVQYVQNGYMKGHAWSCGAGPAAPGAGLPVGALALRRRGC